MQRRAAYPVVVVATKISRQKIVASALRAAREEAGLQQIELGIRIGKTQGYVSKVEGGHQGVDALLLYDIAVALSINPTALFARVTADLAETS